MIAPGAVRACGDQAADERRGEHDVDGMESSRVRGTNTCSGCAFSMRAQLHQAGLCGFVCIRIWG
jgi:hypothetical protein